MQYVSCYGTTHQAYFEFHVFADIELPFDGSTEQFMVYSQTRYRVNNNSAWSAWGKRLLEVVEHRELLGPPHMTFFPPSPPAPPRVSW